MEFLEKVRQVLWNTCAGYITLRELQAMENQFPEHNWREPRRRTKRHTRKKVVKPIDFKFP